MSSIWIHNVNFPSRLPTSSSIPLHPTNILPQSVEKVKFLSSSIYGRSFQHSACNALFICTPFQLSSSTHIRRHCSREADSNLLQLDSANRSRLDRWLRLLYSLFTCTGGVCKKTTQCLAIFLFACTSARFTFAYPRRPFMLQKSVGNCAKEKHADSLCGELSSHQSRNPVYSLNLCSLSIRAEKQLESRTLIRGQVKIKVKTKQADMSTDDADLAAWLEDLREEATQRGVSRDTVMQALDGVKPSEKIMEKDQNQPEKKLTAESYLKTMVNEFRISKGVKAFQENTKLLEEVSSHYGIPASVLTSIWGIESSYGSFPGSWNVVQALVTLAYNSPESRRAAYFREELFHALFILDQGQGPADGAGLKGSWAGAMGQCQFMPSSYRSYAVDYDKDGRKDIWTSNADIFASIANYLVVHGWKTGEHFAQKVHVPPDLDKSLWGMGVKKQVQEWVAKHGVVPSDGELQLDGDEMASLMVPDGPSGVAYLACDNFRVVMRYNTSPLYCMSVYELAREIDARVAEPVEASSPGQMK